MKLPKPFLKWPGGKGGLITQYVRHLPAASRYERYCEPFLGGGAVYFTLERMGALAGKQVVLADSCQRLIDSWAAVRDHVEEVIEGLAALLGERARCQNADFHYYEVREQFNERQNEPLQAARLIYLNKTGFNGLYRENSKGRMNVPCGHYKNPRVYDPENLRAVARTLQNVTILCQDFRTSLAQAPKLFTRDFIYCDPPYYPVSTDSFVDFTGNGFSEQDHSDLAQLARKVVEAGGVVLASNVNVPTVRKLWAGFTSKRILAKRAINSNGQGRGPVRELLFVGGR